MLVLLSSSWYNPICMDVSPYYSVAFWKYWFHKKEELYVKTILYILYLLMICHSLLFYRFYASYWSDTHYSTFIILFVGIFPFSMFHFVKCALHERKSDNHINRLHIVRLGCILELLNFSFGMVFPFYLSRFTSWSVLI